MFSPAQIANIIRHTDIASIVERYVHLSDRSGLTVGICPFHSDGKGKLVVDRELRLCQCNICGKTRGAVDFLMDIEQIGYTEAMERLAALSGVDKTDDANSTDTPEMGLHSRLFSVNKFAMNHFEETLWSTSEGKNIGLAYFHERSLTDDTIRKFHLGYSLDNRSELVEAGVNAGLEIANMQHVGLVTAPENGTPAGRFRSRVIYPVFTVSGRTVAFGGRTLGTSKDIAKYINSPESDIYCKSDELYGLYQAKEAIAQEGKCILVEGYMDVISMHQAGVCNVVASSGTSLTQGQVALLKRFTNRVTVIYDADSAGIKAALRSIDMLIQADIEMDIVLLPDGEDPDSYARSHSRSQILEYLNSNASSFIKFKIACAGNEAVSDPLGRARVAGELVSSISIIPDKRSIRRYVKETAVALSLSEETIQQQVYRKITERQLKPPALLSGNNRMPRRPDIYGSPDSGDNRHAASLRPYEEQLLTLVFRYGLQYFCDTSDKSGNITGSQNVLQYIDSELQYDNITFTNPDISAAFNTAKELVENITATDLQPYQAEADALSATLIEEGRSKIAEKHTDLEAIESEERLLAEKAAIQGQAHYNRMVGNHLAIILTEHPDNRIREIALKLIPSNGRLSRIHSRGNNIEEERDKLMDLIPRTIFNLKYAIVRCRINDLQQKLKDASSKGDTETVKTLITERMGLDSVKNQLSPYIGDVVITSKL